jgi:recombination protein RecT
MSQAALKAAATGNAVAAQTNKPKTIASLLTDPAIKQQMALALPKHMTADRLARIALTEVRKTPKLAQCDQTSFLGAIMQCAALGLEPGGALGHCYLIPFENKRAERTDVQFIVGYRGMIDLARRSGQIVSLTARAVHERDEFSYEYGLNEDVRHVPASGDRGEITYVYAVAKLKDGGVQFEVMSRADVELVRNNSQGYKTAMRFAKPGQPPNTPWAEHFEAMALKTVTRRLFKWLPVSIEIQSAISNDERADAGVAQDSPLVIDGEFSNVTGQPANETGEAEAASNEVITAAEVIATIDVAADLDALDVAADMIRMLPEDQRKDANVAHRARRVALTSQ